MQCCPCINYLLSLMSKFACHSLILALFAGFVNTSIMAREGDNTRICLRVFNPPPAVIISEAFRLQINLQAKCKASNFVPLQMVLIFFFDCDQTDDLGSVISNNC